MLCLNNSTPAQSASLQMLTYIKSDLNPVIDPNNALSTSADGMKYGWTYWKVTLDNTDVNNQMQKPKVKQR